MPQGQGGLLSPSTFVDGLDTSQVRANTSLRVDFRDDDSRMCVATPHVRKTSEREQRGPLERHPQPLCSGAYNLLVYASDSPSRPGRDARTSEATSRFVRPRHGYVCDCAAPLSGRPPMIRPHDEDWFVPDLPRTPFRVPRVA